MKKIIILLLLLLSSCYVNNKLIYFDTASDYCCIKREKNVVSCEYNYLIDIRDITSEKFLSIIVNGLEVTNNFCIDEDYSSLEIITDYGKVLVFTVKSTFLKDYVSGLIDGETLFEKTDLYTKDAE